METRIIEIDSPDKYLTDVLKQIPTNTILYKKLTGLGATYSEIKANRHSIIIEPNIPVITGKCKSPKHSDDNLLGVYEGVEQRELSSIYRTVKVNFIRYLLLQKASLR